ncbi:MAG: tripartite tricarboxylate transporter substrate binding protein [Betaproteobacteria bacterium]
MIATRYVQAAAPDGDTLLFHNSGYVALPMLQKAATYDPLKDLEAVAMVGSSPNMLMVTDSVPAKTIPEFIAYARSLPYPIECANSGINSGGHISAMLLEKLTGVKMLHVPFKGSAEVTTALITNQVKMQVSVTTDSLNPHIKAGKVRILGVATKSRFHLAPDVPTIGEFVPGFAIDGWFGILAPAGTPLARRDVLSTAIGTALADPLIKERLANLFMEINYAGPKDFSAVIADSVANFRGIVNVLGLKAQ